MTRLDDIKKRAAAATGGPWEGHLDDALGGSAYVTGCEFHAMSTINKAPIKNLWDAEFIAHAREDVPWLVARVEELEERLRVSKRLLLREGYTRND